MQQHTHKLIHSVFGPIKKKLQCVLKWPANSAEQQVFKATRNIPFLIILNPHFPLCLQNYVWLKMERFEWS